MFGITGLFDILALIYVFRSAMLGVQIWRDWGKLVPAPLTHRKKHTAEQASFFIAVPVAVFVHEACHALAVWMVGGEVLTFGYRVFWGYVEHVGDYLSAERWFIAVVGTVGSLVTGLLFWLLLRHNASPFLRYFGLRAFRFQIYFSLIYYPIFTLLGFDGDWVTIYDFSATPILSGLTAVAQATILILTYRADRRGWFEMPGFRTAKEANAYHDLNSAASLQPDNEQLQLASIDALRRGGATKQARQALDDYLALHPNSAEATLQLAALEADKQSDVSRAASDAAAKALSLGLSNPRQAAYAHQLIGQHALLVSQYEQAVHAFTSALSQLNGSTDSAEMSYRAQLFSLRSQAYRRTKEFPRAQRDIQEAIRLAQAAGDTPSVTRFQNESDIIRQHASQFSA